MNKINILHVTFDMTIGGTEQVIRQLISHLDTNRFNSSVICIDGKIGEIGKQLQALGVEVSCLNRQQGFDAKLIKHIRTILLNDDIQIVHCHQYSPFIYGLFGSLGTNVKVVFTEHGRFFPDSYRIKRMMINPLLSLLTTEITAISQATKNALVRYELFPANKIKVIYNGIMSTEQCSGAQLHLRDELNIDVNTRIIGTVSRLEPIKNQKMMIDAFHKIVQKIPKVCLLIVGDGPMRHDLELQVERLQLQEKVIFTGFKTEPLSYMSLMEIFLLSSFSEGTSMTLLEAMSLSTPCVVTDVGGNPEVVVNNSTGLVVLSNDMDAFANSICLLLEDHCLMQSYGDSGRSRFEQHFTVEKMVQAFSELYEKALV